MRSNNSTINRNIANIVCRRQQELQYSVHQNWWYGKTKTSLFIKIMREIGFYLTFAVNFIIVNGYIMQYNRLVGATNAASDRAALSNAITAFTMGTVLLIAGYVMQKISKIGYFGRPLGKALAAFILTALGSIQLGVTATGVLLTNHLSNMYATSVIEATTDAVYFKLIGLHILPLLMLLVSALLFYIGARLDKKEKLGIYKRITERLYTEFIAKTPSYSQNDWEDYLDNYKEENEERTPTRSEKSRKKEENE